MKIRRSGAYGTAAALLLFGGMFLPMRTPHWYQVALVVSVCVLAGVALFFNSRERRAGQSQRSIGFFVLAVLLIIIGLLTVLTFF